MGDRIFNFSAGPAILPEAVLKQAQADLWDIDGSGIGILEHSHRGKVFDRVIDEAEADCRALAGVPDNYRVLFLQGGASLQFSMVPANFLEEGRTADYICTGSWSQKAIQEAELYGTVHVSASSEDANFNYIPETSAGSANPAYLHFTSNNTIFGTQFSAEPELGSAGFLACDMSSDIYSRPVDISRYGMIYAGAQKNLGPSGVALVIIREDLLERSARTLPTMLQYRVHAESGSRYNTPPAFGIYVMGQVFKWIKDFGGLEAMAKHNASKAKVIYDVLDSSGFFRGTAREDSRSDMNICFRAPSEDLEKKFISEAGDAGFDGLKGHRSVGGMRASIYNAFPVAGCEALAQFMKDFEAKNG